MEKRLYYNNCKVSTQKVQNKKKFKRRITIMKMNKLAAGALALALGLGAVAPAVASEHTGAELVLERYEGELKAANAAYSKYLDAKEKEAFAKKELDQAEAERKAAAEVYFSYFPEAKFVYTEGKIGSITNNIEEQARLEKRPVVEAAQALNLLVVGKSFNADVDVNNYQDAKFSEEAIRNQILAYLGNGDAKKYMDSKKAGVRDEQYNTAIDRYVDSIVEFRLKLKAYGDKTQAYQNLKAAELKKTAKKSAWETAVANRKTAEKAYEGALAQLRFRADQYGLIVQVGPNGLQIVKPSDAKVKPAPGKQSKEELVKELKKAVDRNRARIESAEFLLANAPKQVAKVKDKLEEQIVTAKAALAKAEAALEKYEKVALVATAYADEETDELEALIKENNDAADAIESTIKENEEAQPEVEEEEEKKPEENKPARQAGTNARTGIAGVAGVAGILAAASVAYAASKRD